MLQPRFPMPHALALTLLALLLPAAALAQDAVEQADPAPGRIVFSRSERSAFDLWTADPDGTNEVQLSDIDESPAGEDYPRWSPDGTRIVFETTSTSNPPRITLWTIGYEGGEPTKLVENIGFRGGTPDWSPDGRCIAFAGAPDAATPQTSDLWRVCEGEAPERLLDTPGLNEQEAVWHPDGTRLAYVARTIAPEDTTSGWQLFELTLDGGSTRPLFELPEGASARFPRWSHDGSQLAFIVSSNVGFDFGTLSVLDVASGQLRPLLSKPSGPFAWAPDDSALLFNNIAMSGVELQPAFDPSTLSPEVAETTRLLQGFGIGLYRYELDAGRLMRLRDKPGGNTCTGDRCFEFGYAPDWTAGTYTPTPPVTATPTPTETPLPTDTPTVTPTPEATSTSIPPPAIYLPRLYRNDDGAEPTSEPAPTGP